MRSVCLGAKSQHISMVTSFSMMSYEVVQTEDYLESLY